MTLFLDWVRAPDAWVLAHPGGITVGETDPPADNGFDRYTVVIDQGQRLDHGRLGLERSDHDLPFTEVELDQRTAYDVEDALRSGHGVLFGWTNWAPAAVGVDREGTLNFLGGQCTRDMYGRAFERLWTTIGAEDNDRGFANQLDMLLELIGDPGGQLEYQYWLSQGRLPSQ